MGSARKRANQCQHEMRESIGDEAAEHSGPVGTRTPDRCVKAFVFGRQQKR